MEEKIVQVEKPRRLYVMMAVYIYTSLSTTVTHDTHTRGDKKQKEGLKNKRKCECTTERALYVRDSEREIERKR